MDKYEFNIKVEQIKKLVNKGDYETAMKIADTIDWRRVRSANLLALVAEIYENNEEYQEAKEILLLAFERAPIGKRLLYKLADLALKENNLKEAEDYYREFCDLAPEDPRQHLLRYQILKAKKASDEQLIHSLERYTNTELDERWLYELAELYGRSGKEAECIQTCDKIMLMFGLGKFVDKAMELKVQYAPLSSYQMDLIENRDKYEEKLRAVEQEFGDGTRETGEDYENTDRPQQTIERRPQMQPMEAVYPSRENSGGSYQDEERSVRAYSKPVPGYSGPRPVPDTEVPETERSPVSQQVVIVDELAMTAEPAPEMDIQLREGDYLYQTMDEELEARILQAETEERLAREMSKISIEEYNEVRSPMEQTKVISSIREILSAYSSTGVLPEKELIQQLIPGSHALMKSDDEEKGTFGKADNKPSGREEVIWRAAEDNYLMIETRTPQKGLELAVEVLKRLHKEKGTKCPVVKITGSKLSSKGVRESAEKLADKDLIIEEAGDLTAVALIELQDLIKSSEIRVILIDNSRQMESLARFNPALGALFTVITLTENGELEIRRPEPLEQPEEEDFRMPENSMDAELEENTRELAAEVLLEEEAFADMAAMHRSVLENAWMENAFINKSGIQESGIEKSAIQESAMQDSAMQEPVIQDYVIQDYVIQESAIQEPVMQESVIQEFAIQEPVIEKSVAEASVWGGTAAEESAEGNEDWGGNRGSVSEDAWNISQDMPAESSVTMEEPAPAVLREENTAAAMAEFMKLMESVMDDESSVAKLGADAQGDSTAAVMAEFMRLMESVMEEPAANKKVPKSQLGTSAAPVRTPYDQGDSMAAAMAAATVPMSEAPAAGMGGNPVNPVMMQSVQSLSQTVEQPSQNMSSLKPDEEMDLHEFVEYTCKYASDIDCSITGKSMLALYERIEVMEENGVPLTKLNAENLIEEAADKAEKFSFKKLFTGLFHSRYDKEGLLILREEHFVN